MVYAIYYEKKDQKGNYERNIHLATSIEELNKIIQTLTTDKYYLAEPNISRAEMMNPNNNFRMFWKQL